MSVLYQYTAWYCSCCIINFFSEEWCYSCCIIML